MNSGKQNDCQSRRNFLRNAALGGLGAITGFLGLRSRGRACASNGYCRGCYAFDACELPQALSAKNAMNHET
jgi:hypothetical protein